MPRHKWTIEVRLYKLFYGNWSSDACNILEHFDFLSAPGMSIQVSFSFLLFFKHFSCLHGNKNVAQVYIMEHKANRQVAHVFSVDKEVAFFVRQKFL